jgi:ubiquinone/menaquinone biosynthesis C-methylase UbiE
MATVFMKWLETNPRNYERGIQLLTLGKLRRLHAALAQQYIQEGTRVLEIGCGTGTLARMMAERGGRITAIDASSAMLAEAEKNLASEIQAGCVTLRHMDASLVGERFPEQSFDVIVSSLVFSELPLEERRYVLRACTRLLAPGGRLLVVDEVVPQALFSCLLYYFIRLPLVFLTWLLTRTTTSSLRSFDELLSQMGFRMAITQSYLGGTLVLHEARLREAGVPSLPVDVPRLSHKVTLRTVLIDLWALFLRIIPPYPKVRPGLYAIGHPDAESPVLVTGNFDLTVRRLVRAIDGKVDAWLLIADSKGINVWCAAGGGYLTAEKIISVLKSSRLEEIVHHRALILPQLCANGVDGWRLRRETGWGVHWGPVRATDIPAYLAAHRKKTEDMRLVRFPLKDRLEMVTVTLGFYGLMILLPVLIFWRQMFWPVTFSLIGLSYFYAVVHPWLPGRDGLWKSIPLTLIALGGLVAYTFLWEPLPPSRLFNWTVGLTGLSVFTGAELQGMSPLMRGEQANWGWEAVIGMVLGLIYWLVPMAIGWR